MSLSEVLPRAPGPGYHSVNLQYVWVEVRDDLIPPSFGITSRVLLTWVAQALVDPPHWSLVLSLPLIGDVTWTQTLALKLSLTHLWSMSHSALPGPLFCTCSVP